MCITVIHTLISHRRNAAEVLLREFDLDLRRHRRTGLLHLVSNRSKIQCSGERLLLQRIRIITVPCDGDFKCFAILRGDRHGSGQSQLFLRRSAGFVRNVSQHIAVLYRTLDNRYGVVLSQLIVVIGICGSKHDRGGLAACAVPRFSSICLESEGAFAAAAGEGRFTVDINRRRKRRPFGHHRIGLLNGILHAGGGIVQRDAGGVLARVGGERAVFQLLNILARLYVADGDSTRRRTLPIAACSHRGRFAFPAVGQLGGGRNGHAAAVRAGASRVCAACGDGRAACRVRPAMLVAGHGERLAVALVAIAAPHINAVLVDAVFRQTADGERLALLAAMRRIINSVECRGPVVF